MNAIRKARGANVRGAGLWSFMPCWLHGFMLGLGLNLFAAPALAIDYHVSPANGDDRYDGLAQAPAGESRGPFASLRRLEKLRLQHGDRVLLHCGERYPGPVRLTLDDRSGGELLIGSYGDCQPGREPVLDPRQPLPAPNRDGLLDLALPTPVVQVFANDEPLTVGRFPAEGPLLVPVNTDASDKRRLPTLAALAGKPLAGARLLARTEEWYIEERAVLSDDGVLDKPLEYALRPRTGLVLTGKRWMLKGGRGWVWDASSQQLTVQTAPGARLSAVTGSPLLAVVGGRGSLTVRGLAFDAAGGDAINVRLDGVVTIEDVTIRRAYGNGIAVAGARQALILDVIATNGLSERPAARRTPITEAEVNSFLTVHAKSEMPAGVLDPVVVIEPSGRLTGRATVDLDQVREAQKSEGMSMLSLLSGRVPVEAVGVLHSGDGRAQFDLQSATANGIPIPKTLLQEVVAYYSRSAENPAGIDLDAPFELPARIREIQTEKGQAIVVQ